MNKNEVYQLLCDGELTLAFDTNVVFNELRFLTLCDNINRLNEAHKTHLCLVVSAIVHTEKWFDLKQKYKEPLNVKAVLIVLESKVQIHGSGKKCGATVDWLIAGYAIAEECKNNYF
jgi:hypothetical protein